ncbi:hypothetical protein GGP41_008137 [Bipolaris sorokiniana]|uniref:TMEM205-like domain-containing protein n=2 Tax=Cochliobolus sativus TaxID=45130 RepID=A0A8H6DY50_COCSA|nr:uncharacterized protein COCSADRAFT_113530 [Bipolaris sorokiniana ND90Pr]EMD66744.1 hypothetical protein COCSADRAFT_113530 [Bipolaris sorokiniana ND90Pr]KAF5852721.1 hypothetical protein GGP41_008137 [Bipolaris sorokiniana]
MFFTTVVSAVLPPVHLLAYSALIGTELYQTFVVTKITYRTLPRPAFVGLQKQLFPAYFKAQSLLLLVVALTRPPYGPFSSFGELASCIPFVIAGVTTGLNLVLYGPRTRALMIERATQATRDSNLHSGQGVKSEEILVLNKAFSRAHAMSIHLNLITIGATLWYGWQLASKLQF